MKRMELPEVVSARKFKEFSSVEKEEVFVTLLDLTVAIGELPKKSLRKTLELTLAVLEFKGKQVQKLEQQLRKATDTAGSPQHSRLLEENEKLKNILADYEMEQEKAKQQNKKLNDEIFQLQKRLQESARSSAGDGSDKDSSDPLSELDKQENLLRNINTKNKHIKRLLKEIENLQNLNIEQSKIIIELDTNLKNEKDTLNKLQKQNADMECERNTLKESLLQSNIDVQRLQGRIDYLEEEKLNDTRERQQLIAQVKQKAESWRKMLQIKDAELKKLKYGRDQDVEPIPNRNSQPPDNGRKSQSDKNTKDNDDVKETTHLLHLLECRNKVIEQLEDRISSMAEEMLATTQLMNQISREREEQRNPKIPRICCQAIEAALKASTSKCNELTQMLERTEEECSLKAKQALEARNALKAYQQGEDGLVVALQKCSTLEHKLQMREKHMRTLIMELNSLHEIAQENTLLRKRLHIPDDMIISAKNLAAKGRNKDKIIERLKLKLRASEELRLQLKLEKAELRKQFLKIQEVPIVDHEEEFKQVNTVSSVEVQVDLQKELQMKVQAVQTVVNTEECSDLIQKSPSNQPSNTFTVASSKEIGEIEDSSNSLEEALAVTICAQCQSNYQIELHSAPPQFDQQKFKYNEILQENYALRQGMLEILEKLREYDESSDQIVIDEMLLQTLLTELKTQSETGGVNVSTSPLQTPHYCEEDSSDELLTSEDGNDSDEVRSVESVRDDDKIKAIEEPQFDLPILVDSSTRPTTPNKSFPTEQLPKIPDHPSVQSTTIDLLQQPDELKLKLEELQIYRNHYEELRLHMNASEMELRQRFSELSERLIGVEKDLLKSRSSYEYLKQDFDRHLSDMKRLQLDHIEREATIKKELQQQIFLNEQLKRDIEQQRTEYRYNHDDMMTLQKSYNTILMKLALVTEQLIQIESNRNEFDIPELCMDYGIIKDNLQLDYIAVDEYESQIQFVQKFEQQKHDLERKIAQLESLLEIAQEQIKSQQRLLNDITDNHINLRHLVADLQNTTEDKLLLTKLQRDLDNAKQDLLHLRSDYQTLKQHFQNLEEQLRLKEHHCQQLANNHKIEQHNSQLKIKFLQKSLFLLREKYAKYTPLILLTNFISAYTRIQKLLISPDSDMVPLKTIQQHVQMFIQIALKEQKDTILVDEQSHIIKLIKVETQSKLYENQIKNLEKKCQHMEMELNEYHLDQANQSEHWQTIQALFADEDHQQTLEKMQTIKEITTQDIACNTEALAVQQDSPLVEAEDGKQLIPKISSKSEESLSLSSDSSPKVNNTEMQKSLSKLLQSKGIQVHSEIALDNKAIQTLELQSKSNNGSDTMQNQYIQKTLSRLQEIEQSYILATEYIKELEKKITSLETAQLEQEHKIAETTSPAKRQTDVIEKTILTFHTLLSEKDRALGKYQDMLQTEREQNHIVVNKLNAEIENLNKTITTLNFDIKSKDLEILELKTNLEVLSIRNNCNEKLELATNPMAVGSEDNVDNSLHEMTDEKIEEMFQQDNISSTAIGAEEGVQQIAITATAEPVIEKQTVQQELEDEIDNDLMKQFKELKDKAGFWERSVRVKDEELSIIKEKLKFLQEREKCLEHANSGELDQLRHLLEDKDKHINQLMDTLNNFHEDQQRYIDDASNYSADQIAKLATDLSRTEATNKIYHTQLEALKKQLTSLTQRERQAREVSHSLRNQLIKRPVVSIKTEINARVKNENLQRRIQQLEMELEESKAEVQKQKFILEAKRTRSANEVSLWEKQKRWQQNAEKYKAKLEETETTLEKTKNLLQSARNAIHRLEKDKQVMEQKLNKVPALQRNVSRIMKCCRNPSCPNLHHHCHGQGGSSGGMATSSSAGRVRCDAAGVHVGGDSGGGSGSGSGDSIPAKYPLSESPDSYMENSSECSSPIHMACVCKNPEQMGQHSLRAQSQQDTIDTLKARLEMQQRKIHALQLQGKGSNLLTNEMEKLHEKLSAIEAQNIRLEASNLQLQLDNDLLRQGDHTERLEKRIKHLEDYIIALKEEIASSEAKQQLCKCSGVKFHTQAGQSAQQTILVLRNLVDKLKAENKYLKDGRRPCESKSLLEANASNDIGRLQRLYRESLDKITALQTELKTHPKCPHCEGKQKQSQNRSDLIQLQDELKSIKEQLVKKTQLLQKAKVLLTRAAAKEKMLKEQLTTWKRKCSELQNVPVIDEISE